MAKESWKRRIKGKGGGKRKLLRYERFNFFALSSPVSFFDIRGFVIRQLGA